MAWWKWKSDTKVEIEAAFANRLLARLVEHVSKTNGPGADDLLREAKECMSTNPIEAMARRMRFYRTYCWICVAGLTIALMAMLYLLGVFSSLLGVLKGLAG